jgi:hypothetical protein
MDPGWTMTCFELGPPARCDAARLLARELRVPLVMEPPPTMDDPFW